MGLTLTQIKHQYDLALAEQGRIELRLYTCEPDSPQEKRLLEQLEDNRRLLVRLDGLRVKEKPPHVRRKRKKESIIVSSRV